MIQQDKITIYFEFSIIIENIIKKTITQFFLLSSRCILILVISYLRLFVCSQENVGWDEKTLPASIAKHGGASTKMLDED